MAVPKYRTSRSKRNMRRSHHRISEMNLYYCKNCNAVQMRHTVCTSCGYYNGKQVIEMK
jgi:large subunit ribosomal protein L32